MPTCGTIRERWPGDGVDDDHDGWVDDVFGVNFYGNTADPNDDAGHGTHVAGILGATGDNGVGITGRRVAGRRFLAIKFQDSYGNGTGSNAVRAINYAIAKGAQVMNNSWGSSSLQPGAARCDRRGRMTRASSASRRPATMARTLISPRTILSGFDVENYHLGGHSFRCRPELQLELRADTRSTSLRPARISIRSARPATRHMRTLSGTSMSAPFVSGAPRC